MYGLNDYFASSWENDFNFHLIHGLESDTIISKALDVHINHIN